MKRPLQVITVILCWLGSLQVASADPVGLYATIRVCENAKVAGCAGTQVDYVAPDPNLPFSISDTYSSALLDIVFSGASRAGFGTLGAAVSADFDGGFGLNSNFVLAGALSLERLTISAPGLDGQDGLLVLDYALDGTMSSTGLARSRVGIGNCVGDAGSIPVGAPGQTVGATCENATFDGPTLAHTAELPFVFGTPFDWQVNFFALAGFQGVGVGTTTIDYLHTLTLVGMHAQTLDGADASNATFASESGTRYSARGVVPEPVSLLLFGIGGLSAVARSRRSARRRGGSGECLASDLVDQRP